jgi:hypothetical protein
MASPNRKIFRFAQKLPQTKQVKFAEKPPEKTFISFAIAPSGPIKVSPRGPGVGVAGFTQDFIPPDDFELSART